MSNMSYCRFENTASALKDCIAGVNEALDAGVSLEKFKKKLSSEYERSAFIQLREQCARFVELYDELDTV